MDSSFNIKYFDKDKNKQMELPLEKMVGMLLALEMNFVFHIEALKAQAVVLRTNLLRSNGYLGKKGRIELNIQPLESYKDIWNEEYEDNVKKINMAVKETEGIVITFEGKPIDAKYQIACGGSTENSENVIDNQVTYLRRVLCNYCMDSPYWKNEKNFSMEEIEELLKVKLPKADIDLNSEISGFMEEIERDEQGRVLSIKVGDKSFRGKELKELLDLNSTRFSVFPTAVKFVSRGKGHGLGLCQYGAEKMATEGATFMEILKYYYTGVEIKKIQLPCIKNPLFGKKLVIDPGHGGEDKGYVGEKLGLMEKDIVLDISLKLKVELERLGATVYLTREKDEKVLVTERAEIANHLYPDFFISFHMDYYPNSNMKGYEMFYFRSDTESQVLGSFILKNLKEKHIPSRGIKEGSFYIFRGINVSSLLIELGYLSNIEEEVNFKDEDYKNAIVEGIKNGILEYFEN